MLPTNIFFRTFFIKSAQYGTAFTLDIDGNEYLVTAKHLLEHQKKGSSAIKILNQGQWRNLDCEVIAVGRGELDIGIIKLPMRISSADLAVHAKFADCYVGQDVFFAGFPYKMSIDYGETASGQPGVFLKKGTLSAFESGPPKIIYVDAINNEGFSGAPLYYFRNGDVHDICIAGVVSKFKVEYETVLDHEGEETKMSVAYNTGFLVAYDIAHAIDLVRNNS
ncbi:trypsin-like peptidase domain-containing protein [uncultured Tolumonas sp.]|uniref:S1 family peptidase n=1 Tax=uncultured Tolumonas sp. TaxID=263765 RepID=UPI002A0A9641|nr:trypsin-like peptidase domain-containing protein [uncultured Tolumonas sp.]